MMDGVSFQQEVLPAAAADDEFASGSHSPTPEVEEEEELLRAEGEKHPLKIHIRLSDLSEAYRKRKPKWYCYQCRITYFAAHHLDEHLRKHVSECQLGVKLVRLPLPADVVATAARRYREADIVERALQQASKDIRDGRAHEPFFDPFREPGKNEPVEEEPFTLRLTEPDLFLAEDGIPEVQAEINSQDEEYSLLEHASSSAASSLSTTSGVANDDDKITYDRGTILGPDLSKTLFEIAKTVIRDIDAIARTPSLPVSAAEKNVNAEKERERATAEEFPRPLNGDRSAVSVIDATTSTAEVLKSINFNPPKNTLPVPKLIPDNIPHFAPEPTKSFVPVPKLIPDPHPHEDAVKKAFPVQPAAPIYTVTKTSATGLNISISPLLKPPAAKTAYPELKNALSDTSSNNKTLPLPLRAVVPVRTETAKGCESMEPERCQSVMILENESRVANNNNNNMMTRVRPAPTLMNHLLAPPLPYRAPSVIVPRRPARAPPTPRGSPPAILRAQWKHNNNIRPPPLTNNYAAPPGGSGASELKIQQVVSLAHKHVMDDPESTCCCMACTEVRCGDLWRKSLQTGPNGSVTYLCAICSERFEGKSQLLRHCRRTKHSYICELCGSGFLLLPLYELHKKVHDAKQLAAKMAVSTSGGGVVSAQQQQQQLRKSVSSAPSDDEVMVVGERILIKNHQRTNSMNGSANPAQLNRILHNSEITLTPISTGSSSAAAAGTNVATGSSLRRILPAPTSVAPPPYPLPMLTTPISTSGMSALSELRKAVTSLAAQHQQQNMSAGARPPLPGNVYRMMPVSQIGPPRSAPTWHHPVATPRMPQIPRMPLNMPRLPMPGMPPLNMPRLPIPVNAALSNSLRQQLTALSSPLYKHILPAPPDPRLRPLGPPNVTLAPILPINTPRPAPNTEHPIRAPPAVAPVRCHVCNLVYRSIVSFQLHFDQVHKKARPTQAPLYKCKRCFRAYTSIPQLQRHEPACGEKVRCRKCNVLLYRNQVITHFALIHSEPGSATADPRLAHALAKHRQQQQQQQPPEGTSSALQETELVEVRGVTKSPHFEITPSITVTPIPTPPAPEMRVKTPPEVMSHEAAESTSAAPEVSLQRPEATVVLITENEAVKASTQPEIVDISADSMQPEVNGIEPEISMMENAVVPEKTVEAVAKPEVYTETDAEADIRKEMNLALEVLAQAEVSRDVSAQPDVVNPAPLEFSILDLADASTPEVSIPEFSVATPEAVNLIPEEPEAALEVVLEEEGLKTPEIDLALSPSVGDAVEERACVVCDRTFPDAHSLQDHLRSTHTPAEPEVLSLHTCTFCRQTFPEKRLLFHHLRSHFTSCSSPKKTSPPKRPLNATPTAPSPKRSRLDEPPPSQVNAPAPEVNDESSNLAVAILDMNKLGASVEMFRRLGVVGFVSLKELKSFLLSEDSTGTPNFIKKF